MPRSYPTQSAALLTRLNDPNMFTGKNSKAYHTVHKRPFLLTQAISLERTNGNWRYAHSEQVSVQESMSGLRPVALDEAARTSSKTFSEPGDDDPDVDGERCY